MNKQEVERALNWAKAFQEHEEYARDTYEDTCGSGDMTNEERKEMYEAMESSINLFKTIASALQQQLTGGWIPVSERLPVMEDGGWAVFIMPSYFGVGANRIAARYFVDHGVNHESGWTRKDVDRATHWMPLPGSWKEPIPTPTTDSEHQNKDFSSLSGKE
jgi:hypothetical protein